ncbi:hypothetical protein BSZ19_01545 [Bradyrhizobium japonicum]|uniref:Uncharacterized protein n=1 Tax=Bradyrhizobium japonicum TaxID=375 RepID=A0A1Y2JZ06_BRAJP|nr:hypothetical protein BSZ19_01545 [Bradyrhizobium japonicum]
MVKLDTPTSLTSCTTALGTKGPLDVWAHMNPMATFNPAEPCRVHDALNNTFIDWKPEWAARYREYAAPHDEGVIAFDGLLLDGWVQLLDGWEPM